MVFRLSSIVSISHFVLLGLHSVQCTQCYFPDGSESSDFPCNASASVSACCSPGWACLESNVCGLPQDVEYGAQSSIGTTARGSCTDATWAGPACPDYCTGPPWNRIGQQLVQFCGGITWVCGNYPPDCQDNSSLLSEGTEDIVTVIPQVPPTAASSTVVSLIVKSTASPSALPSVSSLPPSTSPLVTPFSPAPAPVPPTLSPPPPSTPQASSTLLFSSYSSNSFSQSTSKSQLPSISQDLISSPPTTLTPTSQPSSHIPPTQSTTHAAPSQTTSHPSSQTTSTSAPAITSSPPASQRLALKLGVGLIVLLGLAIVAIFAFLTLHPRPRQQPLTKTSAKSSKGRFLTSWASGLSLLFPTFRFQILTSATSRNITSPTSLSRISAMVSGIGNSWARGCGSVWRRFRPGGSGGGGGGRREQVEVAMKFPEVGAAEAWIRGLAEGSEKEDVGTGAAEFPGRLEGGWI